MIEDMRDQLITVPTAAKRAGVARDTMRRAAQDGKIRAVQLGRFWMIYAEDVDRWVRENYRPDMARRYPVEGHDDKPT